MYWQREVFRSGVAMTRSETYKEDLPKSGLLGSMLLKLGGGQTSGYGQGGGDWRLLDRITKIKVMVNGTHDVKDITGLQAQVLAFLDQGANPCDAWRNYATNTQWVWILVNFGRHLYDLDYGLDLSRFNRAEIWVENNATSSEFGDSLSVTIFALYLREAGAAQFRGYMRSQEIFSKAPVAGSWEYVNLPTEGKLRRLLLQARPGVDANYLENTTWRNLMWDVKVCKKSGALEMMRCPIAQLSEENWFACGEPLTGGYSYHTADKGYDCGVGTPYTKAGVAGTKSGAVSSVVPTVEGDSQRFTEKEESDGANVPIHMLWRGFGLHNTAVLPLDPTPDPASWLDLKTEAQVTVDIQCRSGVTVTSALNKLVTDRLVLY